MLQAHELSGALGGVVLLVGYWALFLPILARQLLLLLREYPSLRNVAARVFEILDAEPEIKVSEVNSASPETEAAAGPVCLGFAQVAVQRSQQVVLGSVNLKISAGEQLAIVGRRRFR